MNVELPREAPDVLVVGAGNAALCAAISAHENGARVLMLEAAPFEERGGNSHFTGGAFRFAFRGVDDLVSVLPSLAQENLENVDFGTYTEEQYLRRPVRAHAVPHRSRARRDPGARRAATPRRWVVRQGVKLQPGLGRQAYQVDGKFKFWGGLALHIWGGGAGDAQGALRQCRAARHRDHLRDAGGARSSASTGASPAWSREHARQARSRSGPAPSCSPAAVSSPIRRCARAISGPAGSSRRCAARGSTWASACGWRSTSARGRYGNWSGCHSVAWDVNAPPYGDLTVGDQFQKHNYPFGIIVNARGERYVDEGANFHSHTYAKYGGEIVQQPGMFAWQVFDAKVSHLLRGEYRIRRVTKAEAGTLEELADKLDGVDAAAFLRTVREFNAACRTDVPFNPNVLDGRRTVGLAIDKTNWANPLDTPPFHAYHVTTGVTFTFGGVKISTAGRGRGSLRPRHPRPLCGRRDGRRAVLSTTTPAAPA